jgi:hypothetical protein
MDKNTASCCLNVGHDFFTVGDPAFASAIAPEKRKAKPLQLRIICRKCGEVRKIA